MSDLGETLFVWGLAATVVSLIFWVIAERRIAEARARLERERAERERLAALRRKYLDHGKPSIAARMAEIEAAGGGALVAFHCSFSLQSHSVSIGASGGASAGYSNPQGHSSGWSSGWSSGTSEQVYKSFQSASMVEFADGTVALWTTKETFAHPIEWARDDDLYGVECERSMAAPVHRIGSIEIAPYSEVNHRATANSFYIYTMLDGKTHVLGTDTELPSAREKAERIRAMIKAAKEATPRAATRRRPGEGIPT